MADSTFESEFAELTADLQDEFGESVTVDGVATTAVIRRPEANALGPGGLRIEMQAEVWIPKSDVATMTKGVRVTYPKIAGGDTVTTTVSRIINSVGQHWHVALN